MINIVTYINDKAWAQQRNINNKVTTVFFKLLWESVRKKGLDYCNALLSGYSSKSLNRLQLVCNSCSPYKKKTDRNSPVLPALPWLPVNFRTKGIVLTYTALNGLVPQYLSESLIMDRHAYLDI